MAKAAAEQLSGPYDYAAFLGLRDPSSHRLISSIERGLPYSALEHLQRHTGMDFVVLMQWLQMAPRTQARRKAQGRLTSEESDRLLRAARVFGRVLDFFRGDREGAVEWLSSKSWALGGATPLEVSRTDVGAREVEDLIERVRHGVYT